MEELVVFLVGPTGVGKTEISVVLTQRIGAEIISCDSMQIYQGMDIGTSKPSPALREIVPHHLIDNLDPSQEYSAAEFSQRASELIEDIHGRARIPLIVGGSGLYVRALIDGLFPSPKADRRLRSRLYREAETEGSEDLLYERLKAVDPRAASGLHPNDLRRIVRALEVYEKTKIPISRLRQDTVGISSKYRIEAFGLMRKRWYLYRRIDERVEGMFKDGLVEEVKRLMVGQMSQSSSQALGYKEIREYIHGEYSLDEAKRLLKRNTRRFAKRQLTWFRKDKRIRWIEIEPNEDKEEVAGRILQMIKEPVTSLQ